MCLYDACELSGHIVYMGHMGHMGLVCHVCYLCHVGYRRHVNGSSSCLRSIICLLSHEFPQLDCS